jgi:cytochrome b561
MTIAFRNSEAQYGWLGQCFHWLVAALVFTQYVLGNAAGAAGEVDQPLTQLALLARHKSVGITVLFLATLRLSWRFISPPPTLPGVMPRWQIVVSKLTHALIYVLIFALPISGWLMSSASSYSVSVFGWFELPDFVAPSEPLKQRLQDLHHLLASILFVTVLIHLAAALKHQFFDKDDVLRRMMPASSFVLLIGVGAVAIWLGIQSPTSAQTTQAAWTGKDGTVTEPVSSDLPIWRIDYEKSFISFEGDQAGARFTGRWQSFEATVHFDADHLNDSAASVAIDVDSVDTRDGERDDTIKGPDFFDMAQYPEVAFAAADFKRQADGSFLANGTLSIKSVATPVQLAFSVEENGNHKILIGRAELDRLALGVGTGDWLDTTWVGQMVSVEVRLETLLEPL